jgi:hemerythrin-like metal-binding protein
MIQKSDPLDTARETGILVIWSDKFAVGIELIDSQHHRLVDLTNELYRACLIRGETFDTVFKEALSRLVEYVRTHFSAELVLLERIKYPDYHNHKKQHDELVKNILEAAKKYNGARNFVPNQFVRTLQDWIFGHIAVYDQMYATYVREQKHKGLLTDQAINAPV